jgi:hypothetical protein
MTYAKSLLAGVAAIFGVFVTALIRFSWGIASEKATGLALVTGALVKALLSPLFWVEAVCVFALLFVAGWLGSKGLRVLLFWIPAIAITTLGCAVIGVLTFVFLRFRR